MKKTKKHKTLTHGAFSAVCVEILLPQRFVPARYQAWHIYPCTAQDETTPNTRDEHSPSEFFDYRRECKGRAMNPDMHILHEAVEIQQYARSKRFSHSVQRLVSTKTAVVVYQV